MARLDLNVFIEGREDPIGQLSRLGNDELSFRYLNDPPPYPISQSLPVQEEAFGDKETRSYFANLLFENAQRDQVMQRHGLDFGDIVGILYFLGEDCPGAISCVPMDQGPGKRPGDLATDYDILDPAALEQLMVSLRDHRRVPDGNRDPSPLAGVQGKVALAQLPGGGLGLPKAGLNVPTTHILKVPRRADMRVVDHEHLLMGIMRGGLDHPVAETAIIGDGDLRGLLVGRFDRRVEGTQVHRLHQEDFCQALGLGPRLKYERDGSDAGRFSAGAVGRLLAATATPGRDRQAFLEITLANLLLGNTDNHAKNHALIYHEARPVLAPVYDVVPTLIDDQVTHELSFEIGRARMTDEITSTHLEAFVSALGYRRMTPGLRNRLQAITADMVGLIPRMSGPAKKRIGDAIAEQAKWITAALEMDIEIPERDLVVINRL